MTDTIVKLTSRYIGSWNLTVEFEIRVFWHWKDLHICPFFNRKNQITIISFTCILESGLPVCLFVLYRFGLLSKYSCQTWYEGFQGGGGSLCWSLDARHHFESWWQTEMWLCHDNPFFDVTCPKYADMDHVPEDIVAPLVVLHQIWHGWRVG